MSSSLCRRGELSKTPPRAITARQRCFTDMFPSRGDADLGEAIVVAWCVITDAAAERILAGAKAAFKAAASSGAADGAYGQIGQV